MPRGYRYKQGAGMCTGRVLYTTHHMVHGALMKSLVAADLGESPLLVNAAEMPCAWTQHKRDD